MPNLGIFLFLSFLGPGIVITGSLYLLWPDIFILNNNTINQSTQIILIVVIVSFLSGHIPFILQKPIFVPIWNYTIGLDSKKVNKYMEIRSNIISQADTFSIEHKYADQILGEYILFLNSSIWILVISVVKVPFSSDDGSVFIALLMGFISFVCIMWTCPMFLTAYVECLTELEKRVNEKRLNPNA
jgi:hypothetical protein